MAYEISLSSSLSQFGRTEAVFRAIDLEGTMPTHIVNWVWNKETVSEDEFNEAKGEIVYRLTQEWNEKQLEAQAIQLADQVEQQKSELKEQYLLAAKDVLNEKMHAVRVFQNDPELGIWLEQSLDNLNNELKSRIMFSSLSQDQKDILTQITVWWSI